MYSIAGDTIEFAKPVIGIKEPAPANFPILLNKLRPVRNALIPIKTIDTIVPDIWISNPLYLQNSLIIWPIEQIKPPTPNALKQFLIIGELGDFLFI